MLSNSNKAKRTLIEFFNNIYNVLLSLETKDPKKFNTGILNLKPSTKLNILRHIADNKNADELCELYIDTVINNNVEDTKGNLINVRSLLIDKNEDFILTYIFKLLTIPKPSDIEPFIMIWKGVDKEGVISPIKLSDRDKEISWAYFQQLDKFIMLYHEEKKYKK